MLFVVKNWNSILLETIKKSVKSVLRHRILIFFTGNFFQCGISSYNQIMSFQQIPPLIGFSPNPGHQALHVLFLTSFYCDVTITHPFDGPFNCDVTMEKSANRCDVGPLAIRQLPGHLFCFLLTVKRQCIRVWLCKLVWCANKLSYRYWILSLDI